LASRCVDERTFRLLVFALLAADGLVLALSVLALS